LFVVAVVAVAVDADFVVICDVVAVCRRNVVSGAAFFDVDVL
jgi:hypothetical protein